MLLILPYAWKLKTVSIIDQWVIAKTSKGNSQGCAFVTVCWILLELIYVNWLLQQSQCVETGDEICGYTHTYNEFLQDIIFSKAGKTHISVTPVAVVVFWRWPAAQSAQQQESPLTHQLSLSSSYGRPQLQGVHSVLEVTAFLSIVFNLCFQSLYPGFVKCLFCTCASFKGVAPTSVKKSIYAWFHDSLNTVKRQQCPDSIIPSAHIFN